MNTKQLRSLESDIEEAGGDTLSALPDLSIQSIAGSSAPPPTRTLQGIEGVLSSRGFNADSGPGSPSGGGEGGGATATAGGEKPASFADYLAAQRSLKKQASIRRRSVPAAVGSDGPEKDGARSPIEPTLGNSNGINDDRGDTDGPPSFNPALLLAASRLKSKATVAKARVAERSASEKRVMHALGTMGQRGSVSDFDWQNAFDELENIDEDGTSDDLFFFDSTSTGPDLRMFFLLQRALCRTWRSRWRFPAILRASCPATEVGRGPGSTARQLGENFFQL